jgi:hypothetical protein
MPGIEFFNTLRTIIHLLSYGLLPQLPTHRPPLPLLRPHYHTTTTYPIPLRLRRSGDKAPLSVGHKGPSRAFSGLQLTSCILGNMAADCLQLTSCILGNMVADCIEVVIMCSRYVIRFHLLAYCFSWRKLELDSLSSVVCAR